MISNLESTQRASLMTLICELDKACRRLQTLGKSATVSIHALPDSIKIKASLTLDGVAEIATSEVHLLESDIPKENLYFTEASVWAQRYTLTMLDTLIKAVDRYSKTLKAFEFEGGLKI